MTAPSPHGGTGFLFVNKTGSSDVLTRSYKPHERFTILSHVPNGRRHKGKEGKNVMAAGVR
jgi:hypothetical protein